MIRNSVRYQLYLAKPLSERLEALAAKPGVTRSSILNDALTAWLDRRGANELDDRFGIRLDRISKQLGRIERNSHVLIESLALFVHYQLTVQAPLPEGDQAGRAIGRDRYNQFVERVAQRLASGKRSFDDREDGQ